MALEVLQQATFSGPALPEPFVRFELENELNRRKLLPKTTGAEGHALQESWQVYRRKLRDLVSQGGEVRVRNHVLEPLVLRLGYQRLEDAPEVETREGLESGGYQLADSNGARLRVWSTAFAEDLDAPARRGRAYRFSHTRIAQRVLLATGERVGLLTNGLELRILISDPARPDSQIEIPIDPYWKRSRAVPDTYRLLVALASPDGVQAVLDLVDKARLQQTRVTKELRQQARQAVQRFVQELLDHPENRDRIAALEDKDQLAQDLWREGLMVIYRLLVILKLESNDDPARSFSFASTSLWRNSFSPSVALARYARAVLDEGAETGHLLEDGLRMLFRMFTEGLQCTELNIKPLGGALFGDQATPLISGLHWGERAVAHLLDRLLWTPRRLGATSRERVHYGPLDVEDLGRVYEALLELEPGIATEPMCRLRRQKLEVVVPVAQGEKYKPPELRTPPEEEIDEADDEEEEDEDEEAAPARGKKTRVEWIEEIPPGCFYLRVGLGRKASGSYYTPHSFVRFLVQETLGPQVAERSPHDDPHPGEILKLKVLDPAMGSGHFLVEACRFLGEKLYEACRLCDEQALAAERRAEKAKGAVDRDLALREAQEWRQRILDLPDPNDELLLYLPSHAPEGEESGLSQKRAEALCRRLVAVHCLYGVDKNPLAVELAKLSLWIESHAEGLPLTFLDHRFVVGDSLTGPFFEHLLTYPGSQQPMEDLFTQGLRANFTAALADALQHVRDLEASVGISLGELEAKQAAKARLDGALAPFKVVAAAWAGGVMLGPQGCDDTAYTCLVQAIAESGDLPADLFAEPGLLRMIARGLDVVQAPGERAALRALIAATDCIPALPYELAFPEVFYPRGEMAARQGFDAVLGNPPWDKVRPKAKEFFAAFDFRILEAPTKRERTEVERMLKQEGTVAVLYDQYLNEFQEQHRIHDTLYHWQVVEVYGSKTGGDPDLAKFFLERNTQLLDTSSMTGVVVPSAFHANQGATGLRWLYTREMELQCCFSFENRRKLFEIHSSFKFALVVAQRGSPTIEFPCAFYLHDDEWLFGDRGDRELRYDLDFLRRVGGDYLGLPEPRSQLDLAIVRLALGHTRSFGHFVEARNVRFSRELDTTDDSWRFKPVSRDLVGDVRDPLTVARFNETGELVLAEGKMFHQFDDRWGDEPRYTVPLHNLKNKATFIENARFHRLAYRTISASTNERTAIFCLLAPGYTTARSSPCDVASASHPTASSLVLLPVVNTFAFDFLLRQIVSSMTVNYFFLERTPIPRFEGEVDAFLAHTALRLTCNHLGYAPLWREQLGDIWREAKPPFTWPVLEGDDERWAVRAAIDAVVAQAYGLGRAQYAHVLSTFSHRSYPRAPELCLARFDELQEIGLEAFTTKHDPYWDIPLNESLPEPVIELPIPGQGQTPSGQLSLNLAVP